MFEKELVLDHLFLETSHVAYVKKNLKRRFPALASRKLTAQDLYELAQSLPYVESDQLGIIIYLVFAVKIDRHYHSLIFASNGLYLLRLSPRKVISRLVQRTSGVNHYKTVSHVLSRVFAKEDIHNLRYLPFVSPYFALMPLGPTSQANTCWANPAYLESCLTTNSHTYLEYSFGFTIESNLLSVKTLRKRMRLAFQALAIYRRDKVSRPMLYQQQLISFIEVPSTQLVVQAAENLSVDELPGDYGDFKEEARAYHYEMCEFYEGDMEKVKRML